MPSPSASGGNIKKSIEKHAREEKRYHPVIRHFFSKLLNSHPSLKEKLFRSNREAGLFIAAIDHAKVHVFQRSKFKSGRRSPGRRKETCTEYFRRYPREFLQFFHHRKGMITFLTSVLGKWKTRVLHQESKVHEVNEPRVTSTPCFMLADHAFWARGVLNAPGRHSGNTFDLATIEGFVYLLHEIYHTMQWYRSPIAMIIAYVKAVARSLAHSEGHILWAHETIEFEMEAIIFHKKLEMFLESHPLVVKSLRIFVNYR